MSKKRAPKTAAQLPCAVAPADQTAEARPTTAEDAAGSPPSDDTNTFESEGSFEAAPDSSESAHRPKGKKRKRDRKDKAVKSTKTVKSAKAAEGDKKEKRDKKNKNAKRERNESTAAPELRPLKKVNVLLIDPNGQPRAHFDGELGVLDLMLPKKAQGDDSGA